MTITVELQRVGASRLSADCIPIEARVLQGGRSGQNILEGRGRWTDIDGTKAEVRRILEERLRQKIEIEFKEA